MHGSERIWFGTQYPANSDNLRYSTSWGAYYNSYYNCWRLHWGGAYMRFTYNIPSQKEMNLVLRLCSGAVNGSTNCPITVTWNGNTVVSGWDPHNMNWYNKYWCIYSWMTRAGSNDLEIKLDSGATTVPFIQEVSAGLFEQQKQQQTQWCWDGTSVSIANYIKRWGNGWNQCSVANNQFGRNDCCWNGSSASCNRPWYEWKGLETVGCSGGVVWRALNWDEVIRELDNKRPMTAGVFWSGGGGHAVNITGAYESQNWWTGATDRYLIIDDPWEPSRSILTYDSFRNSYKSTGTWSRTTLTTGY